MTLDDDGQAVAVSLRNIPHDGQWHEFPVEIKDTLSGTDLDKAGRAQRRKRAICWLIRLLPTRMWPIAGKVVRLSWPRFSQV